MMTDAGPELNRHVTGGELEDRFDEALAAVLDTLPMVDLEYDEYGLKHVDVHMGDWCKGVLVNGVPILKNMDGVFMPVWTTDSVWVFRNPGCMLMRIGRFDPHRATPMDMQLLVDSLLGDAKAPATFDTDDLRAAQLLNTAETYSHCGYLNGWHLRLSFWDDPKDDDTEGGNA